MALMEASLDNMRTWIELPTPAPENYSPTYTHMEDSYVSASGYLVRDIVRRNRAKVEIQIQLSTTLARAGAKTKVVKTEYNSTKMTNNMPYIVLYCLPFLGIICFLPPSINYITT